MPPPDLAEFNVRQLSPETQALLEEFLATQEAILRAAETGALSTYSPFPHQRRLHQAPNTTRFLLGANRIGKSRFLAEEVRYFALGEHPYRVLPGPAKLIWCCCPTEELMLMYQFPEVRAAVGEENIAQIKMGAHPRVILKNGCTILFKYYTQGARAFPSAGVDLICFDEEPQWSVFEECWSRRSVRELNIIGAITTVGGITPLIAKIVAQPERPEALPDCHYETASLDDNPVLSESEKEKMKKGLRNNPVAYQIRVEGKVLPVGGTTRFDANMLYAMDREDVREPRARFLFDLQDERWVQDEIGPLWIWEPPMDGYEYVIGGDIAEGLNVSENDSDPVWDRTSLIVFNRTDQRVVAEFTAGNIEPGLIGDFVLPRLHRLYNRAWANIELNNHGYTVVSHARKHMSSRLWSPVKDHADRLQKPLRQLGSLMTTKSRRYAIDTLAQLVYDRSIQVPSGQAIREMMQFVRKSNGRIEHADGEHDDRVFALAHAVVCDRALPKPVVTKPPTIREQLREIAMRQDPKRKAVQWFRRIA